MSIPTSMTKLINKIERRLGTTVLNLPKHLDKSEWAKVIEEDTLDTFSRYFPHKVLYKIDSKNDKGKDGFYYIDEDKIPGDVTIYGIKDLAFEKLAKTGVAGYNGHIDMYGLGGYEDILMSQMGANLNSAYTTTPFIEFEFPNKISITGVTGTHLLNSLPFIDIYLLIKHSSNLATISPTKMETFEKLAITDIKIFLYEGLKHFDGLETVFANVDLKISDWSSADTDRDALVEKFNEQYVSAANFNQPFMYTV